MKRWLLHIGLFIILCMGVVACGNDELIDVPLSGDEDYQPVSARVIIDTQANEKITLETVRFFLFNTSTGLCVQATEAIDIKEQDVTIDNGKYIISVPSPLQVKKEALPGKTTTYTVFAVINENMGGKTGTDAGLSLEGINHINDLTRISRNPISYSFNAGNTVNSDEDEPAFIMTAYGDITNKYGEPPTLTLTSAGIDRPMAKVTIEKISSGGDESLEASQLFVTGIRFVNIPKKVYLEANENNTFHEPLSLDEQFKGEEVSYERTWENGKFNVYTEYSGQMRLTLEGIYYQIDKNKPAGVGKPNYCLLPPDYAGDPIDFGDGVLRGGATLFYNSSDPYLTLNMGNFLDFVRSITPEYLKLITVPKISDFTYSSKETIIPDDWELPLHCSYYIPENLSSDTDSQSAIEVEVTIGTPIIERPTEDDIKDQFVWTGGTDWHFPTDKDIPLYKTLHEETGKYYYVNKDKAEQIYLSQDFEGELTFTGKDFDISDTSVKHVFTIPIADGDHKVRRNHEYRISVIANASTYDSMLRQTNVGRSAEESAGILVHREVKPLNP